MLSRQEKKRAKRHAKYCEVRNDVLESARASYNKAEPEKKRTAKRQRYWESPESARLAERVRYGKAKRTLQNLRGHRKRTTDKVIQR
ncbi:hypothetical protein EMCRGX_G026552 [Ephydatia muelleri]